MPNSSMMTLIAFKLRSDMSNNSLSGAIPEFLANLTKLDIVNLENNNLSGPVPVALTNRGLSLSLSGNQFLCKPWGGNQCSDDESGSGKGLIIGLVIAAAVALALVCITIIIYRSRAIGKSAESIAAVGKDFNAHGSREFTYKEVQEITRDFQRQIGQGGFGPVYHGRLHNNGLEVAVKVLSENSKQGTKEFSTEVALLSRVHHKNLVSLLGYCSEEGHQILVYEYMSKGNLRKLLHESKTCGDLLQSWETRLDIALNAAQGLEYLHTGCKPPIIHRDVKTSNILVGERMEAKISDFGLSRVGPSSEATHVSTDVKGTFGYLDPAYTLTHNLTEKSDIYSFGVVPLEVMSGRPPIDTNNSGEHCHIVPWARLLANQGNVKGIVDPKIRNSINMASIWKVTELSMLCTESRSIQRPTMSEVVIELKEAIRLAKETLSADYEMLNYASPHSHCNSSANEMSSLPSPR